MGGFRSRYQESLCTGLQTRSGVQDLYPLAKRGQPISQRASGHLGLKDKGRSGGVGGEQEMEPVAVSLMAPERKKKHKAAELRGDINRAVRH